ncbi:MAG: DUF512 domain-containing protein [Candidatus Borkfalkiaceae bacterium]|nr:DUF512 domain-containing protein [Christensenellaceae bacterium]
MLIIDKVKKGSVGQELGLRKGDEILAFDGHDAVDILDYCYYDAQEKFLLTVRQTNGDVSSCEIEKESEETLGLTFLSDNLEIRTCRNGCVFCFVDQMPPGMRDTLYVKDDDYRQSFLCGNFVTLTNLTEEDEERIVRLGMSPLYISVHTMNERLRCEMMRNRFAGKIVGYIDRFAKAGIVMHTQIVMARGINDGKELDDSARKLFRYYPNVRTMAVVPVGMTKFREGLTEIPDIDADYARGVVAQIRALNREFGVNFVQAADEFYFRAGLPVEPPEFYGEFAQIENGVGMTAKFGKEFDESLGEGRNKKSYLLVCGTSAAEYLRGLCGRAEEKIVGLKTEVLAVENDFFGRTVNCTGLLTGGDIVRAVKGTGKVYDGVLMPRTVLKETEDVFLDGTTLGELKEKIGMPVFITDGTGKDFTDVLSGRRKKERIKK